MVETSGSADPPNVNLTITYVSQLSPNFEILIKKGQPFRCCYRERVAILGKNRIFFHCVFW